MPDTPAAPPSAVPADTTATGKATGQQQIAPNEATQPVSKFLLKAETQEEEDSYDLFRERNISKPCGVTASVANMIKGALGAGVLSGHVSYMKAGVVVALITHILSAFYICYCLHVLVKNTQILYKRTKINYMTYPDVGEAAVVCVNSKYVGWSKAFRYTIDVVICIDLFGSCTCYQLIIAKSVKQLVENTHTVSLDPQIPGYPGIKVYVAVVCGCCVLICLLRHLQWLAPMSIVANLIIVLCIGLTVYYAISLNPSFSGMTNVRDLKGFFEFVGICVFSQSCAGVVIPVENNMRDPRKFPLALLLTYIGIALATILISFFGYAAFKDECHAPITVNFPMDIVPKILKFFVVLMIYTTHALNFWVPFQLVFHYLQKLHKKGVIYWEYFYRALIVLIIGATAIVFPSIEGLMGFLGGFCLSLMALIWPHVIELLVVWRRPGFGFMKWRLWKSLFFILFGTFVFVSSTMINAMAMYRTARGEKYLENFDFDEDGSFVGVNK